MRCKYLGNHHRTHITEHTAPKAQCIMHNAQSTEHRAQIEPWLLPQLMTVLEFFLTCWLNLIAIRYHLKQSKHVLNLPEI